MSVIGFTKQDIYDIITSLLNYPDLQNSLIHLEELGFHFKLTKKDMTTEEISNNIQCFMQRAYIANQLAYSITYERYVTKYEIELLKEDELNSGHLLSKPELLKQLESLHYNLYTNTGRILFGKQDEEKLLNIINRLAFIIRMEK